jgi:hypothetical protein
MHALLEAAALPSVLTLDKELFPLGKGFVECSTRQSPLGKIFLGKVTLPSAFYRGTRQNIKKFCRVLGVALGKTFPAVTAPTVNEYFAECPTQHSAIFLFFFQKLLCRVPLRRHSQSVF